MSSDMLKVFLTLLLAICLTVSGEMLLKAGVQRVGGFSFTWDGILRTFGNWMVLAGFALIFAASVFWLVVISKWELSVAYPMLGLSYVVTVIASWLVLREPITWQKVVGSLVICAGVALVGWPAR